MKIAALFTLTLLTAGPVAALETPTGPVVLTVSGAIGVTNAGDRAEFDLDMLDALSDGEFTTGTPWTEGASTFTGPTLANLLQAVDAGGDTLDAVALNDYFVTLDRQRAIDAGALLAVRVDGQRMSVRDKGPTWIVFPYDDDPDLPSDLVKNWSIWQLRTIVVK